MSDGHMSLIEMINTYWRSRGYNVHAHMGR
jgi:hypothetical protein